MKTATQRKPSKLPENHTPAAPINSTDRKHPTQLKGGKNHDGTYHKIINLIPPHKVFIEAFGGTAAITRLKKPAAINIVIEIDEKLTSRYNFPFPGVTVWTTDALETLKLMKVAGFANYKNEDVFVYLDPPYLISTKRSGKHIYRNKFSNDDHEKLCQLIVTLPFKIAISSYRNTLYDEILKGWNRFEYKAHTRQGEVMESVYYNYPFTGELHDYRYAGDDGSRRQVLKRTTTRLIRRLHRLKAEERNAILFRVQEAFSLKKSDI